MTSGSVVRLRWGVFTSFLHILILLVSRSGLSASELPAAATAYCTSQAAIQAIVKASKKQGREILKTEVGKKRITTSIMEVFTAILTYS